MPEINFFDTYFMTAITQEIVPEASFFKDRYFPTTADDIFDSDKVLTEYRNGDRKMACFVAPRAGDIPVAREGYKISEYTPPRIAPSRLLTIDDLNKRGFGEAIYPGSTPAERAARLQLNDQTDLDRRIRRREEWMAVRTMIENGCTIQEYVDANTVGEEKTILFYDGTSDHEYSVSQRWDAGGDPYSDVKAMCHMLARRGLPAADLVLGTSAADYLLSDQKIREMIKKDSGVNIGEISPSIQYPGVAYMGKLNFGGFELNLFDVSEGYVDDNDNFVPYFPATSAMVTAPGCGHMMYGRVDQIYRGAVDFSSVAAIRVPKLIIDEEKDVRKLRLTSRPLAAPHAYCPYIYAANVVS